MNPFDSNGSGCDKCCDMVFFSRKQKLNVLSKTFCEERAWTDLILSLPCHRPLYQFAQFLLHTITNYSTVNSLAGTGYVFKTAMQFCPLVVDSFMWWIWLCRLWVKTHPEAMNNELVPIDTIHHLKHLPKLAACNPPARQRMMNLAAESITAAWMLSAEPTVPCSRNVVCCDTWFLLKHS